MKRILILLASETEGSSMADILKENYDVTLCANIIAANKMLLQKYDAIILDVFLPGMDGMTFLEDNRMLCPPTIILLTTLFSHNILNRAERLGVDALIRKPCEMETVAECLTRRLAEKNPSRITGRGMKSQEDTPAWAYSITHT